MPPSKAQPIDHDSMPVTKGDCAAKHTRTWWAIGTLILVGTGLASANYLLAQKTAVHDSQIDNILYGQQRIERKTDDNHRMLLDLWRSNGGSKERRFGGGE